MMNDSIFSQHYKEKIDISLIKNRHLENTPFKLLDNFVFYFRCTSSKIMFDFHLDNKLNEIEQALRILGKKFIVVNSKQLSSAELETLRYYFLNFKSNENDFNQSNALLEYFNYPGTLQSGLIYYGAYQLNITALPSSTILNVYDDFLEKFYENIKLSNELDKSHRYQVYYSPIIIEPDEIELDSEDKHEIQKVIDKLNEIKNNGNFIALLPILEKHLLEQQNNNNKISRLHIDQDYKIWLIDYNLEIKLSHLSKAIYFLFLLKKDKIDLSKLSQYKKELLKVYLSISNQENLQKMIQSVDLLMKDKKAIYVHLSRIKSAFHKLMHKDIAEKYCIQGAKNEAKGILLERNMTNIKENIDIWFPCVKTHYTDNRTNEEIANANDALSL